MNESESFEVYSNRVLSGNNLLAGTNNHLPKAILCDTIENHLADYLSLKIDSLSSSECEHMIKKAMFPLAQNANNINLKHHDLWYCYPLCQFPMNVVIPSPWTSLAPFQTTMDSTAS